MVVSSSLKVEIKENKTIIRIPNHISKERGILEIPTNYSE